MKVLITLVIVISILTIGFSTFYGVEVIATIKRDGYENRCPLSSPIFVKVKNHTFSTVRNVTFNLELFKNNRSRNLLTDTANGHRVFDVVVPPLEEEAVCFTGNYIESLINPNRVDLTKYSAKEAALTSMTTIKNFNTFEETHKVYLSNVKVSYLE